MLEPIKNQLVFCLNFARPDVMKYGKIKALRNHYLETVSPIHFHQPVIINITIYASEE